MQPRHRVLICLALLHMPQAALAQDALDAAAFEARTLGRTITYSYQGNAYGSEQYLPGNRVLWAFTGSACKAGRWFQKDAQICFLYDTLPEPQCWTFHDDGGKLIARFQGDSIAAPLVSLQESPAPLTCGGPDLGV
jgi:hypothetical protein